MAQQELMLPKGMRDLDPIDCILQNRVLDTIREVFELYGYLPLETPTVERMEVLTAKFGAGQESDIMKEIFQVQDQGERSLGLRFDHTVPLCRYVAMNPTVKLPFKRYTIGKNFRDGPIKLGRYREFWQADADIVGVEGVEADIEGIFIAAEVFKRLNLDIRIVVGSREILALIMSSSGVPEQLLSQAYISLDKLEKIGEEGVRKEMLEQGIDAPTIDKLMELVKVSGSNLEKLDQLEQALGTQEAFAKMRKALEMLEELPMVEYEPTLARGLQYYTGFIYECFLVDSSITSSLIGSGRYDKMIGQFLGGKQDFPAVGFSFGVSVICDALQEKEETLPNSLTEVFVFAVSEAERQYAFSIAQELRSQGIKTDYDLAGKSIGKNFSYADALNIPLVVIIGEDELKDSTATIKIMASGEQRSVALSDLVANIQGILEGL